MNIYNNVIITSTNSIYFDSLLTLISSIHKHSIDLVDHILVYNLDLAEKEVGQLSIMKNVTVLNFSQETKLSHPKFMEPKSYVYKTYCLYDGAKYGQNILWIDSGAMFLQSSKTIFDKINQDHIFLVRDIHKNMGYTHNNCKRIMKATEKELLDNQLWAGLVGYKSNGNFQKLINEAYDYAMIPGCLDGNQENHRHDQSILSILCSRYNCPTHHIDIYGYWTDHVRNIQKAKELGSVVFAHRRGYSDHQDIVYV